MRIWIGVVVAGLALVGCQQQEGSEVVTTEQSAPAPTPTADAGPATDTLDFALAGSWRSEGERHRDAFRHPAQTLEFCQVKGNDQIAEVWPGSGWYSQILLPWTHANKGSFTAVVVDPDSSQGAASLLQRYADKFADEERFGSFSHAPLSATSAPFAAANSQDAVLTFRNVHSWMGRGMAEKAFADFYAATKPGGVLCVVEHRMPSSQLQSAKAGTGYVQVSMVKALAKEAGFVFEAASEINANSKDTAEHPFGVWTLPPVKRSPRNDEEKAKFPDFDRAALDAVGESDRMTLRFRKPMGQSESHE